MRHIKKILAPVIPTSVLCLACMIIWAPAFAYYLHEEAPRTANYFLKSGLMEGRAQQVSKWDLLIVPYHFLDNIPATLDSIRMLNPDQILLAYIDPFQIPDNAPDTPGNLDYEFYHGIHYSWFAYNTDGEIITVWENSIHVNSTSVCPLVGGITYRQYFINYIREYLFPLIEEGRLDGIFLDEMSVGGYLWWDPLFDGSFDYDRNGEPDPYPVIEEWLREAMTEISDSLGLNKPDGAVILGNNCKPRFAGLEGKFYEGFPASWERWLQGSLHDLDVWNSLEAGPNVTTVNGLYDYELVGGSPTDLPPFRYRLTASLLSDCYFNYDFSTADHYQLTWYDLYDFNLGLPTSRRFSLGEFPVADSRFEGEIGDGVVNLGHADLQLTTDPALVLEGEQSLIVDITTTSDWPTPLQLMHPTGYMAETPYTISFLYRIMESDQFEDMLFIKMSSTNGSESESSQSSSIKINSGASGTFRYTLDSGQYENIKYYLKTRGRVTMVIDSLTIVEGPRGVLGRHYERGLVLCNDTMEPFELAHVEDWALVDGDEQHEDYLPWLDGNDVTLQPQDGLVFSYSWVGVPGQSPPPTSGLHLSRVWPNPGNPTFHLKMRGTEGEATTLTLHDIAGRRLATLWWGQLPSGEMTFSFRAGELPLPQLSSGLYLVRAESGSDVTVRRWVLIR